MVAINCCGGCATYCSFQKEQQLHSLTVSYEAKLAASAEAISKVRLGAGRAMGGATDGALIPAAECLLCGFAWALGVCVWVCGCSWSRS